jgi:membrane fusion protein, peptide pheromone/bacteriocin exporter
MNSVDTNVTHTVENLWAKTRVNTHSIYLLLVILLICFLCALPYIFVDISSHSRGIVRSSYENVPITNMVASRLLSVHFQANQQVHRGDTLFVLDPGILQTDMELTTRTLLQNQQELADVTRALQGKDLSFGRSVMQADYAQFQAQLQELGGKVHQAETTLKRNQLLFDAHVIPPLEYEQHVHVLAELKDQFNLVTKKQASQWEHIRAELEVSRRTQQTHLKKLNLEQKHYVITAPISGTIVNYKGYAAGTFVNNAHVIAEISPDQNLLVECLVATQDIGLVHASQRVRFQMDAYNYNYWGFVEGEVVDIDTHVSQQNDQLFVKVRCKLNRMHLKLKNGYQAGIRKGMTLSAHFIVTRRSLYQLLFDHVDAWLNPITNEQKT